MKSILLLERWIVRPFSPDRFGFRKTHSISGPFPKESDTTVALRVPNSTDQQPRFKRPSLCVHVPTALHKCAPRLRGLTVRRSELPARGAFFATPYPLTQHLVHTSSSYACGAFLKGNRTSTKVHGELRQRPVPFRPTSTSPQSKGQPARVARPPGALPAFFPVVSRVPGISDLQPR